MKSKNYSKILISIFALTFFLLFASMAQAATISLSLGSYDTEIYKQETVNIPVTVTATNITGTANIVLTSKSGISCGTCTLSATFTGGTNEQQTVIFTLTGTQAGTYNPPFVSIGASSGSTTATPISSGSAISVSEKPTWTKDFEASDTTINVNDQVTLTLTITPSGGSFLGVSADLVLPSGVTLISGSDPRSIGTVSGTTSAQWIVKGTTEGTRNVQVKISATNPQESASSNIETVSITVASGETPLQSPAGPTGGAGGGGGTGEILNFGNISASATAAVENMNYSFVEMSVDVKEFIANAKVFLEKKASLADTYPKIEGTVYQYIVATSAQITEQNLESADVKFRINTTWLSKNNLDKNRIFLLRYNGNNWVEEPVTLLYSETDYIYYKAKIMYLGTFAVAYLAPKNLEYLKMSSLVPEKIDLEMVIESGLSDSVMIDRIQEYYFSTLEIRKTIEASQKLAANLQIKREVQNLANSSTMTVSIKNNKDEPVSFLFVEAVPKSIVHDVYALKEFSPRKYDLIIREDPVIQWSFGEADTSVVAWEVKELKSGETATFSYSLDANIDLNKYPAPIIIDPVLVSDMAEAASEKDTANDANSMLSRETFSKYSIWLSAIIFIAIIGVVASMYLGKGGKNGGQQNQESHQQTNSALLENQNTEHQKKMNNTPAEQQNTEHQKHPTPPQGHNHEQEQHKTAKVSEYIEHQKKAGKSDDDIKASLKSAGWDEKKIKNAFENNKK